MTEDAPTPLTGPVEIVGAGLIGTSIALVCRRLEARNPQGLGPRSGQTEPRLFEAIAKFARRP